MRNIIVILHSKKRVDPRIDMLDESCKAIGFYDSEEAAREALDVAREQRGFKENPEGFSETLYELDVTYWADGF